MSHWDVIRKEARRQHARACAKINGVCSAEMLLKAADELTGLTRYPVHAGDSLLDTADAVLDLDARIIWYNQNVEPGLACYYQVHEYAHYWLHGEHSVCHADDIDSSAAEAELPLGVQWVKGYSPHERHEREANVFAREFLLPTDKLRQWFIVDGLSATAIATRVGVPDGLVFHQLAYALLTVDIDEDDAEDKLPVPDLGLDETQREAAFIPHGPFLLEAGPGTGKTRSLVGRILFLLEQEVQPSSILGLTFSNRAAEEMRARIVQAAPAAAPHLWIGTFHALGLELLQKYGERLGLPARLSILDPVDAVSILERALPLLQLEYYQHLYDPTMNLGAILSAISRAKDELVSPAAYTVLANQMVENATSLEELEIGRKAQEVARVYVFYQQYLDQKQLLDFGDLIFCAVTLLQTQSDLKKQLQQTYSHILVDEYQDVNRASGLLLRELAGAGAGLWVVGDARQAIYRFRGATPVNMRLYPDDFPGAQVRSLRRNYRSQPALVDLFATLAPQMRATQHSPFIPWEANRPNLGGHVRMEIASDREAEGAGIAREIIRQRTAGVPYRDQAVLCRSNAQLAEIAASLEKAKVPVLTLGDLFARNEIRDLLALLSLVGEEDGHGLARVASFEEYQIPINDVQTLLALTAAQKIPYPTALALASHVVNISPQGKAGIALLAAHLDSIGTGRNTWGFLVRYLFEHSNYLRILLNDSSIDGQQKRLAIFQLLQLAYRQREVLEESDQDAKRSFLRYVRRLDLYGVDKQIQQIPDSAARIDAVRLFTVHAAKGLEFAIVYIPFLGRGKFPVSKQYQPCPPPLGMLAAEDNDTHAEEEECLFFVAISRARDMLCLSRAVNYGQNSNPSELLSLIAQRLPSPPAGPISWHGQTSLSNPSLTSSFLANTRLFELRALTLYMRCPRRYFYEFVLGLDGTRGNSDHIQFLRNLHTTLRWLQEEWAQGHQIDDLTAQLRLADISKVQQSLDAEYAMIYQGQAREIVARAVSRVAAQHGRALSLEWEVQLTHGRVRLKPDYAALIEEDTQSTLLIQRLRAGRPTKSEINNDIYALYQAAAEQTYPQVPRLIQIVYLATNDTQDVVLSPKTTATRLGHYDAAMVGIQRAEFPAQPDDQRKCPQCPHYFICPAVGRV